MDPIDGLGWIYGKWFSAHPFRGYFVILGIVGVIVAFLWLWAIDRYNERHLPAAALSTNPLPTVKTPDLAPPIIEKAEPIIPKPKPPVKRKDVQSKPKEIISDKPIETVQTASVEAAPTQPKEKLADILIRKCPITRETHPELARSPKFQEWIDAINKVNHDPMLAHDLDTVIKTRPRYRMIPPISDSALVSEARFTLHCLESEGYIRIIETPIRLQQASDRIINNETFEFLPGKLNEFNEGV